MPRPKKAALRTDYNYVYLDCAGKARNGEITLSSLSIGVKGVIALYRIYPEDYVIVELDDGVRYGIPYCHVIRHSI